jgi:Zn-finger protein
MFPHRKHWKTNTIRCGLEHYAFHQPTHLNPQVFYCPFYLDASKGTSLRSINRSRLTAIGYDIDCSVSHSLNLKLNSIFFSR